MTDAQDTRTAPGAARTPGHRTVVHRRDVLVEGAKTAQAVR